MSSPSDGAGNFFAKCDSGDPATLDGRGRGRIHIPRRGHAHVTERSKKEVEVLVRSVLPMIERYSSHFAAEWPRFRREDFVSVGMEATHDAALRYDASRSPFPHFARFRILGAFYSWIRKESREAPSSQMQAIRMASLIVPKSGEPLSFDATHVEARAHLVREMRLRVQRMAVMSVAALETAIDPESLVADREETAVAVNAMNAAIASIKPEERKALLRTKVDGETLDNVAIELGVSKKSIQRYIDRAGAKIRAALIEAGIETHESAVEAAELFVSGRRAAVEDDGSDE
jgi:RNA polymerase sigma factor (sigma-70 family)